MERRQQTALALGVLGIACASGGYALFSLTRMLFAILRGSYHEARRTLLVVQAKINSEDPDENIPEELFLLDELGEVFAYGELQELYFRRNPGGPTDWQWSFDTEAWYNTDDLAQEETLLLDPPSLIFIMRLHLVGVARRKNAAAGALLAPPAAGGRVSRRQQAGSRQHRPHIPPPVQLPAWAQQELAQQHGSVAAGSSLQAAGHAGGRQLLDAPDALCCPITGQVMLQPVVTPCGKTFEYDAVRRWIRQHGKDPHSNQPLGLNQLYPNLVVRDMVERWLQTGELADSTTAGASSSRLHSSHLQQLQLEGSEDPLSSFGASSSSGGSSSGSLSLDL